VRRIDKQEVLRLLRQRLAEQLAALTSSHSAAQSGATHEESRQEHPKDTRAIEAQYLARGLAHRVETLRDSVAQLNLMRLESFADGDEIGLSALVGVVDEHDEPAIYFLVPVGGGETLKIGRRQVLALTPTSPIGRALIGRQVGDEASFELPRGRCRLTIDWVA
jgi:transcription elongation GreA/GreB family factor